MAIYIYTARNLTGKKIKGEIKAKDERTALSSLRTQNLIITSFKKKKDPLSFPIKKSNKQRKFLKPRVKNKDIIIFAREFSTLINAGIPMIQSLNVMITQTQNPTLKETIIQVKNDVEQGLSLSEALSKHPKIFSSLFYNMVRAGEMAGVLDIILIRLANYLEYMENVNQRVKTAMRYPLFVMCITGVVTMVLVFFILPKMKILFSETLGMELPALTQFVLTLSLFLKQNFYFLPLIIFSMAIFYYLLKKSDKGAYFLDTVKIKLPVIGNFFHKVALSRFGRTLATLSNSGVPILNALEMTAKTTGNKVIEKAINESRASLREGETIANPLKKYPVFPPMVTNMISVGEETAALDEMLNKIADFYDREVNRMVESIASLIEPLLIVVLGATVGIIVVAMYLPYFTMFQHIG
ncbi:type II secretion system F family protein [Candidatus Aerophobetes bacterium]|nr:type II secretion system F family protein [Candidatus Aerophobetes bacterium]